jgi:mitochondrial protein import protein ZIM17
LIADHLGWFKDSTDGGRLRTIEDLMRAKGETVRRGRVGEGGVFEVAD